MATSTGTISTSAGPLDVSTLVSQLISAESQTQLTPLTTQASSYNTLISAYGSLKSALTSYQSSIAALTSATFSAQKASVSNANSATNATQDPFSADINTDASTKSVSQILKTAGYASSTIFNAGDTLAIKVGTDSPVFVTLKANSTLAGVRDAINAGNTGVTASIVSDDSGDHLVFEANTGGTANTIKIQSNNSLSGMAYDPSNPTASTVTQTQAPRDTSQAASGTYTVGVSQLAQTQKITTVGITPGQTFESGVLAIKTGTGSTTLIKPATNTLSGIRDAINASEAGVNATIVNDGTNDHLVISAKDSGAANTIKITGTGNYSVFSFDPTGAVSTPNVATGTTYTSGSLTLKLGDTTTTITPTDTAGDGIGLDDIKDAINSAMGSSLTASITTDGSNQRLVLTPAGSSATSAVAFTGTGDYSGLTTSGMGQLLKAQDAKLSVDGVTVTSATNKVENVISGVTLNLSKVTSADDNVTLNVANDTTGVVTAATSFVTAYNTLAKAIADLTKQTPSTTLGTSTNDSPLASESSVQTIMNQLRTTLFASVDGGNGISSLSDIGIGFQKDGTLALDSTKISTAATNNFAGIANLFNATDSDDTTISSKDGIVTRLTAVLKGILDDDGIIATKTNGLQASLKINQDRQTAVQTRLSNLKDSYTNQYNALNVTLASMQATQSYLTQQLAGLSS